MFKDQIRKILKHKPELDHLKIINREQLIEIWQSETKSIGTIYDCYLKKKNPVFKMIEDMKVDYMRGGVFYINRVASDINLKLMHLNQYLDYEILI